MSVFKRENSPHWQIEFTFKGQKVRQSSGTAKKWTCFGKVERFS